MARAKLPAKLTLPSGLVVELSPSRAAAGRASKRDDALFAREIDAIEHALVLTSKGAPLALGSLALGDFHVLCAVITKAGLVEEQEVTTTCRNCEAELRARPCAGLEIGPWVDGELGDDELDVTLPFGAPVDVPSIPLGRVRVAKTVTFEARTVDDARPLFAAVVRPHLDVDATFVRAMGIVALGSERDTARIADALSACDDAAFAAVGNAWLATHYVHRLGCIVFCEACGARNDIDAPYERELAAATAPERERTRESSEARDDGDAFPSLDAFAARARDIARPMLRDECADVELVVEGGTPAVDDGGEPLLGSYVPPHPGDMSTPTRAPCVTVYYRTFRAVWDEEGAPAEADDEAFDWDDELRETIEHELEHHVYFLRGEDPMDDEERAEIRDEAVRIVGRREAERRAIAGFGASLTDFLARTWPLWVLAALALIAMLATQR